MNWGRLAELSALLLEYLLLMTAFKITLTGSLTRVIGTYRTQSLILAAVTGFTAYQKLLEPPGDKLGLTQAGILLLIMVLPLALGFLARPLLVRATGLTKGPERKHGVGQTWRDASEQAVSVRPRDVAAFVAFVALAALVATRFQIKPDETVGLTVSLTLHLVGLYIMTSKRDLISQTIGLLVMDHGLYLAVVKIVALPVPGIFFVVALWFYTLITLAILILMVPQVRLTVEEGIDLDRIREKSDLKG